MESSLSILKCFMWLPERQWLTITYGSHSWRWDSQLRPNRSDISCTADNTSKTVTGAVEVYQRHSSCTHRFIGMSGGCRIVRNLPSHISSRWAVFYSSNCADSLSLFRFYSWGRDIILRRRRTSAASLSLAALCLLFCTSGDDGLLDSGESYKTTKLNLYTHFCYTPHDATQVFMTR